MLYYREIYCMYSPAVYSTNKQRRGKLIIMVLLFPGGRVSASGVYYEEELGGSLRTNYGQTLLCIKAKRLKD